MLQDTPFPQFMKNFLQVFTLVLCGFAGTTFADDFRSEVITTVPLGPIRVHGDQFMVIRNFTQDATDGTRGVVTVSTPPNPPAPVKVLAAAILDRPTLEVINSVVIAGPADVTFTCGMGATCFVSFKKDSN